MSAEPTLRIRPAIVEDSATLYRWDEAPHVRAATCNDGTASFDDESDCFVFRLDREPI